ncbi:MAG: ATP-dependent RecD-like DNA helicase [Acidobacteria bacterium]|nr:MAG: ATP-dependent RecD-like DNA helicase [Acidobacteriota bacterium]REJ99516.1 MAG: ATP-dependent RecD-like DNA helicase [Acidobacteriota bacterium]
MRTQGRGRAAGGRSAEERRAEREALAGSVERVTFHNPENGFCVLRLRVRGRRELVTLLGHASSISPGEFVQASGQWQNSPEHGVQFRAELLEVTPPSTAEGMQRYLGSGMIRGVGKELAKRLVAAFGERVFDVIDEHPERLRTVDGIGPVRLRRILEGWREQKQVREIMVFLQSHGVGTSRAVRIYKTYGADAVPLISENPFRLARDIRGIGFRTADQIAQRLGIAKDAEVRARAGLSYTLLQAVGRGHCGLPEPELLEQASELLEIDHERLRLALLAELQEGELIADALDGERAIFLTGLWQAESTVAERLAALAVGEPSWHVRDVDAAIGWVESGLGFELAASQRRAVAMALASKVLVITGGPGVGKTTLVNAILRIVQAKDARVALCAPTGRAAKRLSESTGREAKTIHRLLESDPRRGGFKRGASDPLECDLLVVDETSMVDVPLMSALCQALPDAAALLLVGDVDQLPSVGPGQVLRDLIESGVFPVARLTEIFRQAARSRIVTNAHRINQGQLPELPESRGDGGESASSGAGAGPGDGPGEDFFFVPAADPEDAVDKVVRIVAQRIPRSFRLDPRRDVQVLCPMNRGGLGARSLNLALQQALNPPRPGVASVERFGWTYRVGDKVMQIENDYDRDVYNGDIGQISAIHAEEQELEVRFDGRAASAGSGSAVVYGFAELDQLVLAYATTIHKSQGSEYPAVVLPIAMQHFVMLQRNLVYTGVTRGKQLVVLVGEMRALALAVRGREAPRRHSRLLALLAEKVG